MLWGSRNQIGEVRSAMRRFIDRTQSVWGTPSQDSDRRQEHRSDRVMPALILPVQSPETNSKAKLTMAFTRNLSSEGISVLTNERIPQGEVMILIGEPDHRVIMRGECLASQHIGYGGYQSGVHLREVLPLSDYAPLVEYVEALESMQ